jgi:hypothetical protein
MVPTLWMHICVNTDLIPLQFIWESYGFGQSLAISRKRGSAHPLSPTVEPAPSRDKSGQRVAETDYVEVSLISDNRYRIIDINHTREPGGGEIE